MPYGVESISQHPRGEDPQKDKGPKAIGQGLRQVWDRIQLFPVQKSLWVPEDLAQDNLGTLSVVPATLGRLRWEEGLRAEFGAKGTVEH